MASAFRLVPPGARRGAPGGPTGFPRGRAGNRRRKSCRPAGRPADLHALQAELTGRYGVHFPPGAARICDGSPAPGPQSHTLLPAPPGLHPRGGRRTGAGGPPQLCWGFRRSRGFCRRRAPRIRRGGHRGLQETMPGPHRWLGIPRTGPGTGSASRAPGDNARAPQKAATLGCNCFLETALPRRNPPVELAARSSGRPRCARKPRGARRAVRPTGSRWRRGSGLHREAVKECGPPREGDTAGASRVGETGPPAPEVSRPSRFSHSF
jgi:hypothetical protein